MSSTVVGSWHIRPTPSRFEGGGNLKKTWTGPIDTEMYGQGLKNLCEKTNDNLTRLSHQISKLDPCIEYGVKHWHPNSRPKSAGPRLTKTPSNGKWESLDVMFGDNKTAERLSSRDIETDSYIEPPAPVNKFCYLCTTMEEHQRHMLLHKPKKRPVSAKPRICYIAPKPRVKRKEEEDEINIKERLYRVEVYTTNKTNAGTDAKVYITIRGNKDMLSRMHLTKKQGCSKLCFVRASKEVFHVKGPFLGNLQILTIEHDGKDKGQGWHLDRVEVTDVKASRTWVFYCGQWLSMYEKPLYSNRVDLKAEDKDTPQTEYNIEVHTGKQKMAGTDSNIFITLHGQHGSSKKVHLVDPTSSKKLFEKNSQDKFRLVMPSLGELRRIRIEHDGKGFAAGWFLDKVIIRDSERPKDMFYFTYGGWLAGDEGDGKLWREIKAKKSIPKELKHGTDTKYNITVKTGNVRYAGTDADVYIQMNGGKGATPKIKLDDAKNNFEKNMTDNFEIKAVNVGPIQNIVIGHDNSGPGAGWFLDTVTIRRYVPKDEALDRLKKMKKRIKTQKLSKNRSKNDRDSDDSDTDTDKYMSSKYKQQKHDRNQKEQKEKKKKDKKQKDAKGGNFFSVSSSSSSSSSESSDAESSQASRSQRSRQSQRPGSALRRDNSRNSLGKKDKYDPKDRRSSSASSKDRRESSASRSLSERRVSTSASSQRRREEEERGSKKGGKGKSVYGDDDLDELKVPLYEESQFVCNKWLAGDEDDGLCYRELPATKTTTYFKDR